MLAHGKPRGIENVNNTEILSRRRRGGSHSDPRGVVQLGSTGGNVREVGPGTRVVRAQPTWSGKKV